MDSFCQQALHTEPGLQYHGLTPKALCYTSLLVCDLCQIAKRQKVLFGSKGEGLWSKRDILEQMAAVWFSCVQRQTHWFGYEEAAEEVPHAVEQISAHTRQASVGS